MLEFNDSCFFEFPQQKGHQKTIQINYPRIIKIIFNIYL